MPSPTIRSGLTERVEASRYWAGDGFALLVAALNRLTIHGTHYVRVSLPFNEPGNFGRQRLLGALAPMPTIVCGYFASISTERHAAPMTGVVLGRIVKKEHTQRVLAFLDQREIARAQEVRRSLGEQP